MKITLPNGIVAEKCESVKKVGTIVKTNQQLQYEDANVRRKLSDLPKLDNINIFSQVLCYKMFGLSAEDIATVTKIELKNIHNILMSQEFCEYEANMLKSIQERDSSDVRDFISAHSKKAANKILEILDCGNPKFALPAAQDILDRAGHRPVDVVEHRNKLDNELRVLFITKDEKARQELEQIRPIDAEYEEISK